MINRTKGFSMVYTPILLIVMLLTACGEDNSTPEKKLSLKSQSQVKIKNTQLSKDPESVLLENVYSENEKEVDVIAQAIGINKEDHQVLKEDFFCDLALTARENCELQPRDELAMELCLKMSSYYTNSRHCGYQP